MSIETATKTQRAKATASHRWRFLAPARRMPGSPLAFLLLALAVATGGWNYVEGARSRAEADRLGRVTALSERVLSSMKDLETGQRGYVLTGREDYLAPYDAALARIDGEVASLDAVTLDRDIRERRRQVVAAERDYAARVVALRRSEGMQAATDLIQTGEGKRAMDAVRTLTAQVQDGAATELKRLAEADALRSPLLPLVTLAAGLAAVGLLARLALVRRRESQRMADLLESVLENAPVGLGFLDRDLNLRHMNRALGNMSERGFGADLGAPIWAFLPSLRDALAPKLAAARDRGLVTANIEVGVPAPSAPGGTRHFEVSFFPLRRRGRGPETERADGVGIVMDDVTLGKLAERRRADSEERFRSLTEATSAIVWTTTPDGAFREITSEWTRFTGQSPAEAAGDGFLAAIHPDDREATRSAWQHAVANRTLYTIEHRLRRHDGIWRHMEGRAVPILEEDGRVREWVGAHADVTARKEAELELAAAKEAAEEANRAKSQFLANMSHELRTPLSAVIGYSEMLQEEMEDLGEEGLLGDMRKIEANARHLLGLINDVLDLSKIEAERMEVYAENLDVAETVREVATTVDALVVKKGNTLELQLGEALGHAHTDATKLRQCLINLLSNAAKFTEGGTITLSATREAREGGDRLRFTVADTGIGMSEEQLSRLFQRFTQADASTTRRFGGTGLGLAITRAFARMLGGEITVESRVGEGTTFTLDLPALYEERDPAEPPKTEGPSAPDAPVAAAPGSNLVLVVDDDPATRDLIARFLRRDGFEVATAADGRAGLDEARRLRPRVVLLDVTMPRMDGWAVLRALRADPEFGATPVIMVTVLDEQNLAFSLGATDYLHKPVEWGALKEAMERFRPAVHEGPVLVVDDDPDVRERMTTMLTREGWRVASAENGLAGLDAVGVRKPGLILLDLMMPEMDGFGFLRALRDRPEWRDIPVVVLTAKDITAEDRRRLAGRADRILQKGGLGMADLAATLRGLMSPVEGGDGPPPGTPDRAAAP